MIIRTYKIADILIRLVTPFNYIEDSRYKEFVYNDNECPADFVIRWEACIMPLSLNDKIMKMEDQGYYWEKDRLIEAYPDGNNIEPFRWLVFEKEEQSETRNWTCYYLKEKEHFFKYTSILFRHIGFPILLNLRRAVLLHASFIRIKEKGILFSGPSGIGKSTQAELWKNIEGAELLNGDRAIIKLKREQWNAYGLPYAGSSNIFRNEHAAVAAIVILRQSKGNYIRRLQIGEAYRSVLLETYRNYWDSKLLNDTLNDVEKMINSVPVYLLECTADERAVKCLKNKLKSEGILI